MVYEKALEKNSMNTLDISKTCCFTGSRPKSLPWGSDEADSRCIALKQALGEQIERAAAAGFENFISGMALGVDLIATELVAERKRQGGSPINLVAAIPFLGQENCWSASQRQRYWRALEKCDYIHVVSRQYPPSCFHRRNQRFIQAGKKLSDARFAAKTTTKAYIDIRRGSGLTR